MLNPLCYQGDDVFDAKTHPVVLLFIHSCGYPYTHFDFCHTYLKKVIYPLHPNLLYFRVKNTNCVCSKGIIMAALC